MNINSLPVLVFRLIFSKLSLRDLLNAGRVCLLWRSYQLEIGEKVRSLTLIIGPNAQSQITNSCFTLKYRDLLLNEDGTRMYSSQYLHKRFHLYYGAFSSDCAAELLNIFPHITTLEIAINFSQGQIVTPLVTLFVQWFRMLKSLKMYLKLSDDCTHFPYYICTNEANEFACLLDIINSMQSLEHLTLDFHISIMKFFDTTSRPNLLDLPILGQLHEFFFQYDTIDIIEKSLKRFAMSNDNLRQIGLEYFPLEEELHRLLPQLASKIVRLTSVIDCPKFRNFFKSFSPMIYLNFRTNPNAKLFNGGFNYLALLPQLTYLHLDGNIKSFLAPTRVSPDRLHQLTSVQVLTLFLYLNSTVELRSNLWAHLFPNVQVIKLELSNQDFLRFHIFELQRSLETFVQCPKLHHIYTRQAIYIGGRRQETSVTSCEWTVQKGRDRKIILKSEQNLYESADFHNY